MVAEFLHPYAVLLSVEPEILTVERLDGREFLLPVTVQVNKAEFTDLAVEQPDTTPFAVGQL